MNRKGKAFKDYFNERASPEHPNLLEYADVTSPLSEQLNNYEVVGALILFLVRESTPIQVLVDRYGIHDTWKERFTESFFLVAEEVARDFQVKGFTAISMRLLGYCERIAAIVGRPEFEERFKQRKLSIYRGRYPKWRF